MASSPRFLVEDKLIRATPIVAYRYWVVNENEELRAPLWSNLVWRPGFNRAVCNHKRGRHNPCKLDCGMYAFRPYEYDIHRCDPSYFDVRKGKAYDRTDALVGSVILLNAVEDGGHRIRAPYGHVASLTVPSSISEEHRERAERIARQYGVDLVEPSELYSAAHHKLNELSVYRRPWRPRWFSRVHESSVTD